MHVDVALLPARIDPEQIAGRAVVVFDVLRASTTMIAALSAWVSEIRVFDSLDVARAAAAAHEGEHILCGESNCLPPEGFDLGNSPCVFSADKHRGKLLFMCTTNGTRAIYAAQQATRMLIGALANADAVAELLVGLGLNVTLLCAGTNGQIAMEDLLGAGAVLNGLLRRQAIRYDSDVPLIAEGLFQRCRHDLGNFLRQTRGGQNVLQAGLAADIDFAAQLNSSRIVPIVRADPLRVVNLPLN